MTALQGEIARSGADYGADSLGAGAEDLAGAEAARETTREAAEAAERQREEVPHVAAGEAIDREHVAHPRKTSIATVAGSQVTTHVTARIATRSAPPAGGRGT